MKRTVYIPLIILTIFIAHSVSAQEALSTTAAKPASPPRASTMVEGMIIDTIVIENRNVFDTTLPKYRSFLFRTANKLRFVTRPIVVRRELLFKEGDLFKQELAEETARNLRNRSIIYDASVTPEPLPNGHVLVRVVTIDQWSLLGGFRIRREGNETDISMSLEERNLLGNNQLLSFEYNIQEQDRDYGDVAFRDSRVFGRPYQFEAYLSNNPIDKISRFRFGRPYYNLAQRFSFDLEAASTGGRRDIYDDTLKAAESESHGRTDRADVYYRWGSLHSKVGLRGRYLYRYQRIDDRRTFVGADTSDIVFPSDSIYHQLGIGPFVSLQRFVTTHRISGFGYTEDIALGLSVDLLVQRAFRPRFDGAHHNLFTVISVVAERWSDHLFTLSSSQTWWVKSGLSLRHYQNYELKYFFNRLTFLTVAARARYEEDDALEGNDPLVLGGRNGLRGYDTFFRTGEKLAVGNLELRFFPGIEILSAFLGGVIFVDVGAVAKHGEKLHANNLYTAPGVGLRVSMERLVKSSVFRIDVAHTETGQWQLVMGSNQAF